MSLCTLGPFFFLVPSPMINSSQNDSILSVKHALIQKTRSCCIGIFPIWLYKMNTIYRVPNGYSSYDHEHNISANPVGDSSSSLTRLFAIFKKDVGNTRTERKTMTMVYNNANTSTATNPIPMPPDQRRQILSDTTQSDGHALTDSVFGDGSRARAIVL